MVTSSNYSSDKKPLFTIIMPCYNSEDYIDRSIQSCINQTFENWELIIINDGSQDHTLNIINSYIEHDTRISVFSKINGGYVSAVNFGLEKINGKYFMFLGSDDELCPNLFSDIFSVIQDKEQPDFIGFRTLIKKDDQSTIIDKNSDFTDEALEYNSNIKSFSAKYPKQSSIFFTRDTSKLYKSELLGNLRYLGKKGMDADGIFSMMFSHKASSFLCVPSFGYIWYLRAESLSGRKKDFVTQVDRIDNWIKFGNEIIKIDNSLITEQEKYYLTNYFYSILKWVYFNYPLECLRNKVINQSASFIKKVIDFWNIKTVKKEIKFLLSCPYLWKCFIIPKILFEKINKRLIKK